MSLSIKYKAALPVIVVTLIGVCLGIFSVYSLQKIQINSDTISRRFHELEEVRSLETSINNLLFPYQRFVAEHDLTARDEVHSILHNIDHLLEDLHKLEVVNDEEKELIESVNEHLEEIRQQSDKLFNMPVSQSKQISHQYSLLAKEHLFPLKDRLNEWHVGEVKEVDEINDASRAMLIKFVSTSLIFLVVMLGLVPITIWLHTRTLIKPLMVLARGTEKLAKGDLNQQIHLESRDEVGALADNINNMAFSLDKVYKKLERMTVTDQLTGLLNRHALPEIFSRECNRVKHTQTGLGIVLLDIDHFKSVNDRYGHATGDEVLRHVASVLSEQTREYDYLFRYGGEEFLLLIPSSNPNETHIAVERLRHKLECTPYDLAGEHLNITASFGYAYYPLDGAEMMPLLNCADIALYSAKSAGRNKIVRYGQ